MLPEPSQIPAVKPDALARRKQKMAQVALLRSRLMIYLYRHPLRNTAQTIHAIERAESLGEIRLLLDYVLAAGQGRRPAPSEAFARPGPP